MKSDALKPVKKIIKGLIFLPRVITAPSRVLPDVLIIGAQKAGTTSLYNYLVQHPDVFPSYRKEVHFFDHNYNKGINWYKAFFPLQAKKAAQEKAQKPFHTIDASPYYMVHPHVPARAKELLPNAKIIIILRDPVDRAVSHYNHEVRKGTEKLPISEAFHTEETRIKAEKERLLNDKNYHSPVFNQFSYKLRGEYINQIEAWKKYYRDEQIHIIFYEDLVLDPQKVMGELFKFIGVEPISIPGLDKRHNQHPHSVKADEELVKYLSDHFKIANRKLFSLVGKTYNWK